MAVALLLAPQSGEKTRRLLDDMYQEGADHLGEKIRDGKDFIAEKSREVVEDVEEKIDNVFIVTTAFPAEKNSYPVKWLIVLLSTIYFYNQERLNLHLLKLE